MIESIKYKLIRAYQLLKNGWSYYDEQGNFSDFPYWIEDTVLQRFIDEWPESRKLYDNDELDKVYDWIVFDLWNMQERLDYLLDRLIKHTVYIGYSPIGIDSIYTEEYKKERERNVDERFEIEEKIMKEKQKMLHIIVDNLYDVSW